MANSTFSHRRHKKWGQTVLDHLASGMREIWTPEFEYRATVTHDCIESTSATQRTTTQFGGTPTDGNYTFTFSGGFDANGDAILGTPVAVTVTRSGGTPATNNDLAVQAEADIEAAAGLSGIVASADDSTDTNLIQFATGVSGVSVTLSAPAPGTLAITEHRIDLDLNDYYPQNAFPANVKRLAGPVLNVREGFGASITADVGDANDPNGLISAADINTAGYTGGTQGAEGVLDITETAFEPHVFLFTGTSASPVVSVGDFELIVNFHPLLET